MQQIYKFEAKLANGAAEQSLSRDVYRLANGMDFFRLLSFFHTGLGFYLSNTLTIATVFVFLYTRLYLGMTEAFNNEKYGDLMIRLDVYAYSLQFLWMSQVI